MKAKRLFIVGHPGAGKGYLAKTVAEKLGYQFIDADLCLEDKLGLPLNQILGDSELKGYMSTQDKVCASLLTKENVVIATDGSFGLSVRSKVLLKDEVVVFLQSSTEVQMNRSVRNQDHMIDEYGRKNLYNHLHDVRDAVYEEISQFSINIDDGDVMEHAGQIIKRITENSGEYTGPQSTLSNMDKVYYKDKSDTAVQLTDQEANCFRHLADGKSAKEIAKIMDISNRTVETYVSQLKDKLDCKSSKDLIRLYHGNP